MTKLEGLATAATGTKVSLLSRRSGKHNGNSTVHGRRQTVGDPRPVVRGIARLDLTFGKAGTKSVTAVFTATGDEAKYTSAAHVLTVTGDTTGPVDPDPTDPGTGRSRQPRVRSAAAADGFARWQVITVLPH
ncbi:hypothetical protein ACETU7_29965 [Rhodococcus sp. 3Y1]